MLYRYYIGSNNKTGKVEDAKAIRIIAKQFEGFSAFKGLGYWQGKPEESLFVEVETEDKKAILNLAKILVRELNQQAIGLAEIGHMQFVS